jgi:diamine N-acetyltransferase
MHATLHDITPANWQQCIHLHLPPRQSGRIASNLYSLAEAYVEPQLQPRAIYADGRMIGFVMYEFDAEDGCYWIPRFMIDIRYQGQGYGRQAIQAVIDELRSQQPDAPIMLSITPDNEVARNLYLSLGFVDTGRHKRGEDILRYG